MQNKPARCGNGLLNRLSRNGDVVRVHCSAPYTTWEPVRLIGRMRDTRVRVPYGLPCCVFICCIASCKLGLTSQYGKGAAFRKLRRSKGARPMCSTNCRGKPLVRKNCGYIAFKLQQAANQTQEKQNYCVSTQSFNLLATCVGRNTRNCRAFYMPT